MRSLGCQALGYSGPVRAVMLSNFSILAPPYRYRGSIAVRLYSYKAIYLYLHYRCAPRIY